jgi:O-antigen/teichoic acid export membrane protein
LAATYGLRSSGLLVFSGRIISAFTGLLFTFMVARWLNASDFGTWEVITTMVTFSAYPVGIAAYWATRDVARGRMIGRTALYFGAILSGLGLLIYFGFTVVTYSKIASSLVPFLLGVLLVPLSYWSAVANSIVQGFKPGVYGYSLVISEIAKLGVAYDVLFVDKLGINGVIIALMAAYLVQSAVSTYFVRITTAEKYDASQVRSWSRLAWLPVVSYLPTVLAVADTYVAAIGFGTALVGYYQVAFTVASVVGYSSGLAFSLYPLLLRGGDERLPAQSIEYSLLFAVPMAAGGIAIAGPILYLFGSPPGRYLPGAMGLAILAVMFVFTTVSWIVDQTLLGTEKADVGERPRFRALMRSNLLFVATVNILYGVVYVSSLYFVLAFATSSGYSTSSSVALWATVELIATVAFMLVKARRAARSAKLMPGRSAVYYIISAAVMASLVYLVSGTVLVEGVGTLNYGARLVGLSVLGGAVYFGIVYLMDSRFRDLAQAFLRRIRR